MVVSAGVIKEKAGNNKARWDIDCVIWTTTESQEKQKQLKKKIKIGVIKMYS
jgi:hypothetical protein